jgi:hypothetical protein
VHLPRSRTLPLLRTPAPFRGLVSVLALAALNAAALSQVPRLIERTRLAQALLDATSARIDPVLALADHGRWPTPEPDAPINVEASDGYRPRARITPDGLAFALARADGREELGLRYTLSPGGTLSWRCSVTAVRAGAPVDPLSLPAECRE